MLHNDEENKNNKNDNQMTKVTTITPYFELYICYNSYLYDLLKHFDRLFTSC